MSYHSAPAGSSIIGDTCTVLTRLLTVVEEMDVRNFLADQFFSLKMEFLYCECFEDAVCSCGEQ
jgi:hypothetical protein